MARASTVFFSYTSMSAKTLSQHSWAITRYILPFPSSNVVTKELATVPFRTSVQAAFAILIFINFYFTH